MSDLSWLQQHGFSLRAEWGPRGAREAAARGDVIVVVDVLSFTTAVTAGVGVGASVVPGAWSRTDAAEEAARLGAHLKTDDPTGMRALSPRSFSPRDAGRLFLLRSPNGATCSALATRAPAVFAGCLRNASAVAAAARDAAQAHDAAITVIPCGEIWPDADASQRLRPCVEDALGAGAILAACDLPASPEASLLAQGFATHRDALPEVLHACISGRELVARQHAADVVYAAEYDVCDTVPVLRDDRFVTA